jgi:hypothetical protein
MVATTRRGTSSCTQPERACKHGLACTHTWTPTTQGALHAAHENTKVPGSATACVMQLDAERGSKPGGWMDTCGAWMYVWMEARRIANQCCLDNQIGWVLCRVTACLPTRKLRTRTMCASVSSYRRIQVSQNFVLCDVYRCSLHLRVENRVGRMAGLSVAGLLQHNTYAHALHTDSLQAQTCPLVHHPPYLYRASRALSCTVTHQGTHQPLVHVRSHTPRGGSQACQAMCPPARPQGISGLRRCRPACLHARDPTQPNQLNRVVLLLCQFVRVLTQQVLRCAYLITFADPSAARDLAGALGVLVRARNSHPAPVNSMRTRSLIIPWAQQRRCRQAIGGLCMQNCVTSRVFAGPHNSFTFVHGSPGHAKVHTAYPWPKAFSNHKKYI